LFKPGGEFLVFRHNFHHYRNLKIGHEFSQIYADFHIVCFLVIKTKKDLCYLPR